MESAPDRVPVGPEESETFSPRFGLDGLIPCIAVDAADGSVLMMAWMNGEALRRTLETGLVHYWSRSRGTLWKKGEGSGALQQVVELRTDCDQDVLLARVTVRERAGTCHTGRSTCFYRQIPMGGGPIERPFERGNPAPA